MDALLDKLESVNEEIEKVDKKLSSTSKGWVNNWQGS